jgi:Ca2+-binding EF-hand superfamily protein
MPGSWKFALAIVPLLAAGALTGSAWADNSKVQAADSDTKQLLLLMDQDRNGKVSKQEFMNFMEGEFNRLDTNKDGELDVYELTGLRVRRSVPGHQGK